MFSDHHLNNEKKSFIYRATEADRGGFGVTYFFVKDNRFYQFAQLIMCPGATRN